jgi:hypothetical protein
MMKNTEIKTYRRNRFLQHILFIGVFSFISITLHGADAPKTAIGTFKDANPGQLVTVPVTVTGFTSIGSFYLYLEYDYSKIQYTSVTKNPLLTGNFNINDIDLGNGIHRIILSWSGGIYGISLADGSSMVEFVFNCIAGSAELKWNTASDNYCAFTDPRVIRLNDSPKPTYYVNGEVSSFMPSAPKVGTITHPTYSLSTGSVELTGLPSGIWTINPGTISGTGPAHTIPGLAPGTYNYTVTNAGNYTSAPSANVVINPQVITAVDDISLIDNNGNQGLRISSYPNPFCRNTTIEYTIPVNGKVGIKLYNHLGQQVASLVDAIQDAGKYAVNCSLNSIQPGFYIARITLAGKAGNRTRTIKLSVHE